ncbi:hypothetical protein DFJ73DRAFT_828539 [Zopfochytrium polystomum]|nr:hypothetical protein DFJ73DRAFT_828539 [Zopfochytrium polystomum]
MADVTIVRADSAKASELHRPSGNDSSQNQQPPQPQHHYVAVPNEFTPILIPPGSKVVILDRSPRRRRGFVFGFILVLMAYYFLSRRAPRGFDVFPGVNPENEFEPSIQCLPDEASVVVYPDLMKVEVPSSASALVLDVKGVGIGTIQVEIDSTVSQITVENHFHLTPNILPELVNVSHMESSGRHTILVQTPHCLGDGCRDHRDGVHDHPHPGRNVWLEVGRDGRKYHNKNGCVVVASRIRIPATLAARATLPDLSNHIVLTTVFGSIHVGGLTAATVTTKSEVGSVRINTVDAPTIDLRSTTGSISAKNVSAEELKAESASGSITATVSHPFFRPAGDFFGSLTFHTSAGNVEVESNSGSVDVKVVCDLSGGFFSLSSPTAAQINWRINTPFLTPNAIPIEQRKKKKKFKTNFFGKFLITSNYGSVSVSGSDLTVDKTKNRINGTRGYGDDLIHGLVAVTRVGSSRATFL